MPILHSRFGGEGVNPQGETIQYNPKAILESRGPVVQVSLSLAEPLAEQLLLKGEMIPEPIAGFALIDTGASSTCIDEVTAQKLGLPVVDRIKIASASHDAMEMNAYPTMISFISAPIKINATRAIGVNLNNQGIIVLLGRDMLRKFIMFYNGPSGELTISL